MFIYLSVAHVSNIKLQIFYVTIKTVASDPIIDDAVSHFKNIIFSISRLVFIEWKSIL